MIPIWPKSLGNNSNSNNNKLIIFRKYVLRYKIKIFLAINNNPWLLINSTTLTLNNKCILKDHHRKVKIYINSKYKETTHHIKRKYLMHLKKLRIILTIISILNPLNKSSNLSHHNNRHYNSKFKSN